MSEPSGIYWLASYPKSGNTWFRLIVTQLLMGPDSPVDLNTIQSGMIASSREWMDVSLGFESALLTHDEIDCLRPEAYRWLHRQLKRVDYHKIHDAYTYLPNGDPLIPPDGCLGALYLVRNPLDVAISFANHQGCSIDNAIEMMNNPEMAFCKRTNTQYPQVRQKLLSWSDHVKSWRQAPNIPVQFIRYEDMLSDSLATFSKAMQFLKIETPPEAIKKAIDATHISKLQTLESETGFNEKPPKLERFFRKGISGDWKTTLTPQQIQRIINDHGEVMQTLGYLDSRG